MEEQPTVSQQVTQTLAEAYNLLNSASLDGIKGGDLVKAGSLMVSFQSVIQAMAEGKLEITEVEEDIEIPPMPPALKDIIEGEDA